jgi:hypothetical protein
MTSERLQTASPVARLFPQEFHTLCNKRSRIQVYVSYFTWYLVTSQSALHTELSFTAQYHEH